MRKTMLLTCLLLLTGLTTVHAGRRVMLGVRGGFELTEMNFNAEDLRESNRVGFYIGPSIEFALPLVGLGIDISALYFGFGLHLENQLEAGVYYNVPVGKTADFTWDKLSTELKDTTWSSAKTKTNAWHISLTYFF